MAISLVSSASVALLLLEALTSLIRQSELVGPKSCICIVVHLILLLSFLNLLRLLDALTVLALHLLHESFVSLLLLGKVVVGLVLNLESSDHDRLFDCSLILKYVQLD